MTMKRAGITVWPLGLVALMLVLLPGFAGAKGTTDFGARPWTESVVQAFAKAPDATLVIQSFILRQVADADASSGVCSYAFADLTGGGTYELVASIDLGGRDFCNQIVVISRAAVGRFQVQSLEAWRADEVSDVITKLDGSAKQQLVVPEALSNYEGGPGCVAIWPAVYEMRGAVLVNAGRNYPQFYRQRLTEAGQTAASDADACRTMETDKLKRWLGIAPSAGLATAQSWMKSPDPALRAKAARVFADIGDGSALATLRALAKDTDPAVADTAHAGLIRSAGPRKD